MQTVRLKRDMLVEATHRSEGEVIRVADARAADLIRGGHAEKADGVDAVEVDHPLADAITPMPPDGVNASALDAALPTVADNPGLVALETASRSGAPRRAAKISGKAD